MFSKIGRAFGIPKAQDKDEFFIKALEASELSDSLRQIKSMLSSETLVFDTREHLRKWAFGDLARRIANSKAGAIALEFGVHKGASLRQIATNFPGEVYGFDAFRGLRDPWSKPGKIPGSMDLDGKPPKGLDKFGNLTLLKGWVEDTLPEFLNSNPGPISLVHFDMDVYSPTRTALGYVKPRLHQGSIIIIDDFAGFIGWQNHSFKALNEVFEDRELKTLALSRSVAVFEVR